MFFYETARHKFALRKQSTEPKGRETGDNKYRTAWSFNTKLMDFQVSRPNNTGLPHHNHCHRQTLNHFQGQWVEKWARKILSISLEHKLTGHLGLE